MSTSLGRFVRLSLPLIILVAAMGAARSDVHRQDNGVTRTPPMGWNSWNHFGCNVSAQLIRETADAIAASGMRDAGYQYVTIDDCWQVARDQKGVIIADSARFPGGIRPVADYVHAKGLKFGIYTDAGRRTCEGRPGSYGFEELDAKTYAQWGVDYVKVDWCNAEGIDAPKQYAKIRDALLKSGRPIVCLLYQLRLHSPSGGREMSARNGGGLKWYGLKAFTPSPGQRRPCFGFL